MKHLAARPMSAHQQGMDGFTPQHHWTMIGQGASADVWAVDESHVVKLFRADVNDVPIALEYAAGLWAEAQGIPVARPIRRITVKGEPGEGKPGEGGAGAERSGILFAHVDGPDMLSAILHRPFRMWPLIRRLARLHARIHRAAGSGDLPRQVDVLRHRILRSRAGEAEISAALALLDRLPQDSRLVHGDLHPANLLLSSRGAIAIDWAQAASGVPAADAARTELLLRFGGAGVGRVPPLAGAITAHWYRHCYARFSGLRRSELDIWRLPVAVAWQRGQLGAAEARLTRWISGLMAQASI
ncbi:aminoglycoside phosphotransferase family protein [Sphingobium sp. HBC34]|uniref:Aminoglycoside phosphotransferase family protein n=1 Tax=Sphingobium cyanobacteriorum TaxID=3063954 RepID=A0ABT8ZPJ3_9SPHN|nr:aminoglycoside phosphotransferase family protein [Sphingobium sp. HBC34]MDO7836018.1 aminoglycoside phosphotransferase family protein [Sphingobium sp. HBC34]